MGVLNMSIVNTTPGVSTECPYTPPAGWGGDDEAYHNLIALRYRSDRGLRERLQAYAYNHARGSMTILGPYREKAELIMNLLSANTQ